MDILLKLYRGSSFKMDSPSAPILSNCYPSLQDFEPSTPDYPSSPDCSPRSSGRSWPSSKLSSPASVRLTPSPFSSSQGYCTPPLPIYSPLSPGCMILPNSWYNFILKNTVTCFCLRLLKKQNLFRFMLTTLSIFL